MLKNPRDKGSREQRDKASSQLRNHHERAAPGVPDKEVLEPADMHAKLVIGGKVHKGNEKIAL